MLPAAGPRHPWPGIPEAMFGRLRQFPQARTRLTLRTPARGPWRLWRHMNRLLQFVSQFGKIVGNDRVRPHVRGRSVCHIPDSAIRKDHAEDVVPLEALPQSQDFGLVDLSEGRSPASYAAGGTMVCHRGRRGSRDFTATRSRAIRSGAGQAAGDRGGISGSTR